MIIHLTPRMFASFANPAHAPACSLIDFRSPELGLYLKGGVDVVARRPYPNKRFLVACRKIGQKAIDGILIETQRRVVEFNTLTRWAVGAERVVTHHVRYFVLDDEFDAISEKMVLWHATGDSLGNWPSRWPTWAKDATPAATQPRMELFVRERGGTFADRIEGGLIVERAEVFQLPTIEPERFIPARFEFDRMPVIEHAFRAAV
ncbi:hypothetical protein GYC09_004600 [Salmonella enterica]|nr:hypothetical protein [Salmonella enterica]